MYLRTDLPADASTPVVEEILARWDGGLHGPSCPDGCPVVRGFSKRALRRGFERARIEGYLELHR